MGSTQTSFAISISSTKLEPSSPQVGELEVGLIHVRRFEVAVRQVSIEEPCKTTQDTQWKKQTKDKIEIAQSQNLHGVSVFCVSAQTVDTGED